MIVSDLRMPGVDGITLLAAARARVPDTTRVLLTGQADLGAAIDAVNEGHVFRFLRKPCHPDVLTRALQSAAEQYRLVTAERVLLSQTLRGSIEALTDVLSLASPAASGRARRVQRLAGELADELGLENRWAVDLAALLSQLGCISLPPVLMERIATGQPLSAEEQEVADGVPIVAARLLGHIPRLEPVRALLTPPARGEVSLDAQVLQIALAFDTLETRGMTAEQALDALPVCAGGYHPSVLAAIRRRRGSRGLAEARELRLADVQLGMTFANDVVSAAGLLLVARGQEVTPALRERIRTHWSEFAAATWVRMFVSHGQADTASPDVSPTLCTVA